MAVLGKAGNHRSNSEMSMESFEPKYGRALWRLVYDHILKTDMQIDEVLTYKQLAELLPDEKLQVRQAAVRRTARELEAAHSRTLDCVAKVGYRMVPAVEHERLARGHHKRAYRQVKRAGQRAHAADRSQLTMEQAQRMDHMERTLRDHARLLARLDERVKRETRERQSVVAALSGEIDVLREAMTRYGIPVPCSRCNEAQCGCVVTA
jgi:hypothetical protein